MRWLIVEDALRDRQGHWFEYLSTFARELRALGDQVTVLSDRAAEPFLIEQLQVRPILPPSIWHRMSDGAGVMRRYLRLPVHAWQTYRVLKKYLRQDAAYEVIFVPTVLVHHLLGWRWLIKGPLRQSKIKVLLFFPNTPIQIHPETGQPVWLPTPTAKLFCRLIQSLKQEVETGRVILGAETQPMCAALTQLSGVPFAYFPHPVASLPKPAVKSASDQNEIVMGAYGSARHEKGSDLLVPAVEEYCRQHPETRARFVLQSVGGDAALWKRLENHPKVRLIPGYFGDGEYARQLQATNALLLPYRRSSYDLRVSRVVIEAMILGLPVVATQGTTLASQAEEFGAAVLCQDGDTASLVNAIRDLELRHDELQQKADRQRHRCISHFSVRHFRELLAENLA